MAVKKRQADRIILDLNDSNLTPEALRDRLQRDPIHVLREIKIVKGGKVTSCVATGIIKQGLRSNSCGAP